MDTKLLKQKILDLAIHGKLVPQNPNDESATVLLEKIRAEKAEKIKKGELKADKKDSFIFVGSDNRHYEKFADGTVKDIEDEIPFEVPEGWAWCRLKDIGQYKKGPFGSALTKSMFVPKSENTIKVYEQKNAIQKNHFLGEYYITREYFESDMQGFEVFPGDILVSCAGTIGETYILPDDIEQGIINQALMKMRITDLINKEYFLKYFDHILKDASAESGKGTAIKNIPPFDIFKNFLFPLPPFTEQNLIIKELQRIFSIIDSLETDKSDLQTAIKQAKSKILDLAIHGKLVPQDSSDEPASVLLEKLRAEKEAKIKAGELKRDKNDSYIYKNTTDNCHYEKFNGKEAVCIDDEIPFEIPNSWQWCKLNELGETNIGLTYHPTDLVNTGIPVLRSNNIQNDSLCLDDLARVQTKILENQFVSDGDILICARNGSQALVGKCTIIGKLPEKMAFGAFMAIFRSKYNKYIIRYLQSFYFKDYLRESNSTQIYQLTQSMLKNALIPLPPISEQKRIATKIEEMFNLLDQIQSNLV